MMPFKPTKEMIDAFKDVNCLFISWTKRMDGTWGWKVTDPHTGEIITWECDIDDVFHDPFYSTYDALFIFDEEE